MVKNLSDSRLLNESARGAVLLDASLHSSSRITPSCRMDERSRAAAAETDFDNPGTQLLNSTWFGG